MNKREGEAKIIPFIILFTRSSFQETQQHLLQIGSMPEHIRKDQERFKAAQEQYLGKKGWDREAVGEMIFGSDPNRLKGLPLLEEQ